MTLPFFETGGMPDHYSHTGECWICISNLVKETQQDVLRSWVLRSCTSRHQAQERLFNLSSFRS